MWYNNVTEINRVNGRNTLVQATGRPGPSLHILGRFDLHYTHSCKTDQFSRVLFLIHSRYLLLPPVMGREITSGTLHVWGTTKQEQCCILNFTQLYVLGSNSTKAVNRMDLTHIHGWLWRAQSRHLEVIPSSLWWAILQHLIAPERGQTIRLSSKSRERFSSVNLEVSGCNY